ncbi:Hypothetical protein CINCED_3A010440 [Cinara cedri]|uniref:Uncharacterized protein n=1 Tax=Cinara cedri TaxID=506608 RepID=A0A5E4NI31_9HEMI|nr:Hypothetical protein CINCED_3A010440 [Cinara cedri]
MCKVTGVPFVLCTVVATMMIAVGQIPAASAFLEPFASQLLAKKTLFKQALVPVHSAPIPAGPAPQPAVLYYVQYVPRPSPPSSTSSPCPPSYPAQGTPCPPSHYVHFPAPSPAPPSSPHSYPVYGPPSPPSPQPTYPAYGPPSPPSYSGYEPALVVKPQLPDGCTHHSTSPSPPPADYSNYNVHGGHGYGSYGSYGKKKK